MVVPHHRVVDFPLYTYGKNNENMLACGDATSTDCGFSFLYI